MTEIYLAIMKMTEVGKRTVYRFGNEEALRTQWGPLRQNESTIIKNKTRPVNPKASFNTKSTLVTNRIVTTITLPTAPALRMPARIDIIPVPSPNGEIETKEVLAINDKLKHAQEDQKLDLMNFIDVDKLHAGRTTTKNASYKLNAIIKLVKELNLFKNNKNKEYFIDVLKEELNKTFHQEKNLVGDLKALDDDDIRDIQIIKNLFKKQFISQKVTDDLLIKIKKTLKDYSTSTDLQNQVVNVIEKTWMPKEKAKTAAK